MSDPIELYYWSTPNGWKISIVLEELGLPYNVNWVNINRGDQFTPEFLEIGPNNRMPVITDPDGPDGEPISIFESGAILQYLARKTGKLYGSTERERITVDMWLMWQMGGLGPMAGQAHHFLHYTPQMDPPLVIPYAQDRYRNECRRLYNVLNTRLEGREFVAGDFYSIADIAIWSWADRHERHQNSFDDLPYLNRWYKSVGARPAVLKGRALDAPDEIRNPPGLDNATRDAVMFGQTGDRRKSRT